jgi:hypothetical protein
MGYSVKFSPDDRAARERAAAHRKRATALREALIAGCTNQGEARRLWGRAHGGDAGGKLRHFHQLLVGAGLYDGPEPNWGMLRPRHPGRYGGKQRLT